MMKFEEMEQCKNLSEFKLYFKDDNTRSLYISEFLKTEKFYLPCHAKPYN